MSMIQLRIGPADHGRALTLEEFRDAEEEEGCRFEFGILEYWIVDPQLHQVTVLVREGADWTEQVVAGEQTISSAVLPGLICPVAELWVGVAADESDA
jgi:hypothetical protein